MDSRVVSNQKDFREYIEGIKTKQEQGNQKMMTAKLLSVTADTNLKDLNFSKHISASGGRTGVYTVVSDLGVGGILGMSGALSMVAKFNQHLYAFVPASGSELVQIVALSDLTDTDVKLLDSLTFEFVNGRTAKFEFCVQNVF